MASPFVEVEIDTPTGEKTVKVTNPDRVYFSGLPEGRGRKLDLVDYYLAVGEGVVRALRDRPTVLKRHPDGAEAGRFEPLSFPVRPLKMPTRWAGSIRGAELLPAKTSASDGGPPLAMTSGTPS